MCKPLFPDAPGRFHAKRKHDLHKGVDLYCELGQKIVSIEDGFVEAIKGFTGSYTGQTWWNDTQAVYVRGESGVFVYGEVTPLVKVGDKVKAGDIVAVVDTAVLRSFKGRPTVMLHLEHRPSSTNTHKPKLPGEDINPEITLREIVGGNIEVFDLSEYDGKSFKDPDAPVKDSRWWGEWQQFSHRCYQIIKLYYSGKKSKRSQVSYINHIDEGVNLMRSIESSDEAIAAFMLHPLFQMPEDLLANCQNEHLLKTIHPKVLLLAMEYRNKANAYLCRENTDHFGADDFPKMILPEVRDMLIADKVQNYKDFLLYHAETHERSEALDQYFNNWFSILEIDYEEYKEYL